MTGDIDPLRPLRQRHAEAAALLFGAGIGALQLEQVFQSDADALTIALRALILQAPGDGITVVETFQCAGYFH